VGEQIKNGVSKKRVGIKPEKIIAREGSKIFKDNKEIGVVTSGGFGPSVGGPVAMGYVLKEFSNEGESLELEVRGKRHEAVVYKMPFYKKSYVK
jgi:aminomethyltransferase